MTDTAALAKTVYAALRAGDEEALDATLDPSFTSRLADGMPVGGGRHDGPIAAREDGWWAIGREFSVFAEPEEWIPCGDGRLLVRGRYRGRRRSDGAPVDAAFMHLWRASGGRLVELHQVTDTARWGGGCD